MDDVFFNAGLDRYELNENGHRATADIRLDGQTLFINLVYAPIELRGTGTAGRLMAGIVADAKAKNLNIHPMCGYASAWLDRHPA